MTVYQRRLDKKYKPPSSDMIKRRLTDLVKGGVPVRVDFRWLLCGSAG